MLHLGVCMLLIVPHFNSKNIGYITGYAVGTNKKCERKLYSNATGKKFIQSLEHILQMDEEIYLRSISHLKDLLFVYPSQTIYYLKNSRMAED